MLQRAETRGELRSGLDYRLISETLIGALFVRLLLTREPVNGAVTEHIVDLVLATASLAPRNQTDLNCRTRRMGKILPRDAELC